MNKPLLVVSAKSRGAAQRAMRRNLDDADSIIERNSGVQPNTRRPDAIVDPSTKLKVTFLGGLQDVGEKNMTVIEYGNDAVILDCGMNLGVDLPGINYAINSIEYLEQIKHKIKAYVITHGHLDHIGGLRHTVPKYPAPIYGSRYTIGVIERSFEDEIVDQNFVPNLNIMNIDSHEQLNIGCFSVEFIRVTHAIPDPAAVCIETPVGRIIATGDFRLDPEPLDNLPSDVARLKQLGDLGVLLLMSDSSYADAPGRTPTEHTLQKSFTDIITQASGRIFVAVFSSNINRTQMIINAAVASGRKIALDGRSMLGYVEIAVKQGILKVPKGSIVSMQYAGSMPPDRLLVMCTGGQGEPNAALQRMSTGDHKYVNLNPGDTVIISSSPIPGNEVSYDQISNRLKKKGVHLFRHVSHQIDGCGPLHVSGHAKRDELRDMLRLVRPKFFIPVHAGTLRRHYHAELGVEEGVARSNVLLPENGDSLYFKGAKVEDGEIVPHGNLLVDQSGQLVDSLVVKDRIVLAQDGILAVVLTIDNKTGKLLTSPDIISRGFIALKGQEVLLKEFRSELKRAVDQRFKRVDHDRFKVEIKDFTNQFFFAHTGRSPLIIPVVNIVGGHSINKRPSNKATLVDQEKRFAEMRAQLLGADQVD